MNNEVGLADGSDGKKHPLTLKNIALYTVTRNLDRYLKDKIIPYEVCDLLIENYQRFQCPLDDNVIRLFYNTKRTPLRFVDLRNSLVTVEGLKILLQHKLQGLSLWYCEGMTKEFYDFLDKSGENLQFLDIGIQTILNREVNSYEYFDVQKNWPYLKRLVLNDMIIHREIKFLNFPSLIYLNLSSCNLKNFSFMKLCALPHLQALILFNSWLQESHFEELCQLTNLKVLDISIERFRNVNQRIYDLHYQTLKRLFEKLEKLTHLDISGTNIIGNESDNLLELIAQKERPLEYLGLYDTTNLQFKPTVFPAIEFSGNVNERQILTAGFYNLDRPLVLGKVLYDLYHWIHSNECENIDRTLKIVLEVMDRHLLVIALQVNGSGILFQALLKCDRAKLGVSLRNHIIRTLLNGMQMHIDDKLLMQNFFMILSKFPVSNDLIFEHRNFICVLLGVISETELEERIRGFGIFELSKLCSQDQWRQRLSVDDLGVVRTMLGVINDRIERSSWDIHMGFAWKILWNLITTSFTVYNSFIDNHGVEFIVRCLNVSFANEADVLEFILCPLLNISEVKLFRMEWMSSDFINCIVAFLDSNTHGVEISYCAAGILTSITFDGIKEWTIETPTRNDVLIQLVETIKKWNLGSVQRIICDGLKPFLRLILCCETPQCQHWAVWTLANLTYVNPKKYCPLVEKENMIPLLTELECRSTNEHIKELIQRVIIECNKQRSTT